MHDDEHRRDQRADLREMLDSWEGIPAFLRDKHLDIVAANGLARALSPAFNEGVNLARFAFIDAAVDRDDPNYPRAAGHVAAMLRESLDLHHEDDPFRDIVGELSAKSRDFATAWAEERPADNSGSVPFVTPVGRMQLNFQQLIVPGGSGDVLMVFRPADHSAQVALTRLAEVAAGASEA
ncbi:hypothetical protein ACFSBZ_08205 [Amnibacterium flavum]|uniref:MmyB-like transcription regulator ligand binding domain-containing protein n=1 Tax=Amnibacterium flavum TaxID=2173173 RepID=A0A2V1HLI8_9MICO|nr:hypothetical protein [Amnibacterium flavum]PVZ93418.1 hypothetical protein DDQ50_15720 [Amnibacterium flavum]